MNAPAFTIQQRFADRRDFALLGATPALMQPRFGTLPPLQEGYRYIVGRDGLFVEARKPSLHALCCVAPTASALPYGTVEPFVRLPGDGLPDRLMADALARAGARAPQEWAGLLVHDEQSGYRLVEPGVTSRSAGHVSYDARDVEDDTVVADLHSHGDGDAYFSATDDEDDTIRGGFYLALVLGQVRGPRPSIAMRLVIHGHLLPLEHPDTDTKA